MGNFCWTKLTTYLRVEMWSALSTVLVATAVTLSGAAPLTHYGNDQCLPGETRIDFLGNGTTVSICSPKCEGKEEDCPKDVPAGTTAKPTCALKYNGTKF